MAERDDWCRSAAWSAEDRQTFERRLSEQQADARSRCLRIKALALIEAGDAVRREAGHDLLMRLIREERDPVEVATAHEVLARSYERAERLEESERQYRRAIEMAGRAGAAAAPLELALARLLVRRGGAERYREAGAVLDGLAGSQLGWNAERFAYAVTRARIAAGFGRTEEGAAWAREALKLAALVDPEAARQHGREAHPEESDREELRRLARGMDAPGIRRLHASGEQG